MAEIILSHGLYLFESERKCILQLLSGTERVFLYSGYQMSVIPHSIFRNSRVEDGSLGTYFYTLKEKLKYWFELYG